MKFRAQFMNPLNVEVTHPPSIMPPLVPPAVPLVVITPSFITNVIWEKERNN